MSAKRGWITTAACLSGLALWLGISSAAGMVSAALSAKARQDQPEVRYVAWLRKQGYVEVPLQLSKGGALDVAANGNGQPLLLFLDTGSSEDLIDPSVQKRLKVPSQPTDRFIGGAGGKTDPLQKLILERFTIGTLHERNEPLIFAQAYVNKIRHQVGDPPCDGQLGSVYLARHGAVIDYRCKKLFIRPLEVPAADKKTPQRPRAELAALLKTDGYREMLLSLGEKTRMPQVAARIKDAPLRLVVDTGALTSVLTPAVVERLHLTKTESTMRIEGVGGTTKNAWKTRAAAFFIGPVAGSLDAYLLDLSHVNATLQAEGDPPCDGLLGAPYLREHGAIIDFPAGKMYLLTK